MSYIGLLELLIFAAVIQVTGSSRLSVDFEAQRKCKEEYKKECTGRRLCAIQHLQWPMNMSFPVCIPRTYVQVKMRVCELPPQPGDCGARFIRWFYNKNTNKCSWFYFQGCRGNQNNFKSREECETQCIADPPKGNRANGRGRKPLVLAATSPVVISDPVFLPDRTKNQIIRPVTLRSKKVTEFEKEIRRKRRLQRKKRKRIQKNRRNRRRRKGLKGKKRRRDGKVKGRKKRKKRNKNKTKRKNKKRKNKRKKYRKNNKNKNIVTTLKPTTTKLTTKSKEITTQKPILLHSPRETVVEKQTENNQKQLNKQKKEKEKDSEKDGGKG